MLKKHAVPNNKMLVINASNRIFIIGLYCVVIIYQHTKKLIKRVSNKLLYVEKKTYLYKEHVDMHFLLTSLW